MFFVDYCQASHDSQIASQRRDWRVVREVYIAETDAEAMARGKIFHNEHYRSLTKLRRDNALPVQNAEQVVVTGIAARE